MCFRFMDDVIFAHITGHMDRGMSSDIAAAIASSRAIKLVASSGTSRKVPADGGGVCNIYIFIRINCSFKNKKFNKKTKEKETHNVSKNTTCQCIHHRLFDFFSSGNTLFTSGFVDDVMFTPTHNGHTCKRDSMDEANRA